MVVFKPVSLVLHCRLELFASAVDEAVVSGTGARATIRSYFSLVCLGHGRHGLAHKIFALLWQIWLRAGPTEKHVRAYLDSIQAFTSDFGVEHGIVDALDYVPLFFAWLARKPMPDLVAGSYLFANAYYIPGFQHLIDGVLKDTAYSLLWMPNFIAQIKNISQFLTKQTYKDVVLNFLESAGRRQEAKLVRTFTVKFIKWRWGYFATCVQFTLNISFLREAWADIPFKDGAGRSDGCRDGRRPLLPRRPALQFDLRPYSAHLHAVELRK